MPLATQQASTTERGRDILDDALQSTHASTLASAHAYTGVKPAVSGQHCGILSSASCSRGRRNQKSWAAKLAVRKLLTMTTAAAAHRSCFAGSILEAEALPCRGPGVHG